MYAARLILGAVVVTSFGALAIVSCSDVGENPSADILTATPSSVTVTNGTSQDVAIGGGKPPYLISEAPTAGLARAVWTDSAHTPALLKIIGAATVATGSTSVKVRDSSPSPVREVQIPIKKN